jgi:ribosome recycling factor
MAYELSSFKKNLDSKIEWLKHELSGIRTGRATPALLDSISVEVYGSKMRLQELASIGVEDARTLYISPWDGSQVKPIEKAVTVADLGVSVGSDEKGVRVSFPELTSERREQLMKLTRAKLEEARIAVKNERTKVLNDIGESDVSEDEEKRLKVEVQKLVDDTNDSLEGVTKKKEAELAS